MKYAITGGAGHTSGIIAEKLLAAGKDVTVVGRNAEHLKTLQAKGAKTAIGSLEDAAFVSKVLADADAVYTMIPPSMTTNNYRAYQNTVSTNFYNALKNSRVKYVVNLSSVGAHLKDRAGVVNGLRDFEDQLNTLPNVNVKHLRPGYFFYNLFGQIPMIKAFGSAGGNFSGDRQVPVVHPNDIGLVGAEELLNLSFTGKSARYIAGEVTTMNEAAKVLGKAIGKPDLKWMFVPDAQLKAGMIQGGLTETIADGYIQLGQTVESGEFIEDFNVHKPELSPTKLSAFANEFVAAFNAPASSGR
jgi:uncharacterized protein YbjT (DUF2867 family)